METDKIMSAISKEILSVLKGMEKAKGVEEKKTYSETVKNLTESLEVFFNFLNDMAMMDDLHHIPEDLIDDEDIPF